MKKYSIGSVVKGKVTGVESYGFFVEFDDKSKGLVHISEISGDFVKDVNDFVKVNDEVDVEVIGYEEDNYKLSIKKFDNKGKNTKRIAETASGFNTLKEFLPVWISEKEKMILGDSNK